MTLLISIVGAFIVFDVLFRAYGFITDPILVLMLLFLFAEPLSLGHLAILDKEEDESEKEKTRHMTYAVQHVVGLLAFTISNIYFIATLLNHYPSDDSLTPTPPA